MEPPLNKGTSSSSSPLMSYWCLGNKFYRSNCMSGHFSFPSQMGNQVHCSKVCPLRVFHLPLPFTDVPEKGWSAAAVHFWGVATYHTELLWTRPICSLLPSDHMELSMRPLVQAGKRRPYSKSGDPGKSWCCSLIPKAVFRQNSLFLDGGWSFSIKIFNWFDKAHPHCGR